MKKSYRTLNFVFSIALSLIITIATIKIAHAAQYCNGTISYAGRVLQGCKDNYTVSGNVYWKGKMISKVSTGSAISQMGWNFWSDTRYCGGVAVAN